MALIDKASLLMVPSTYEAGKLYNVLPSGNRAPDSTDQNSGYDQTRADFDFDRGSNASATRIGSDGLIKKYRENLLLQSNQFDTTWIKNNSSVTSGQADKDGGTNAWLLERSVAFGNVAQNISQGGVQTFSIFAKAGTYDWVYLRYANASPVFYRGAFFNLSTGVVGTIDANVIDAEIESVGDGWYRCSITYNQTISQLIVYPVASDGGQGDSGTGNIFIQSAQLESGLVATDYLDSTSVTGKAGVLVDLPRINYDANGQNGALLLEPSRANLITQSEYFGDWSTFRSSVSANDATSPEGLTNAYKLIQESGQTSSGGLFKGVTTIDATTYTYTFFAKEAGYGWCFARLMGGANNYYAWFDLSNGIKGNVTNGATSAIEPYGNDWYRCSITFANSGTLAIPHIYIAEANSSTVVSNPDGVKGINIYGAMIESGSYVSSYIPTTGTSETRAADVSSISELQTSSILNGTKGTFLFEGIKKRDWYFTNFVITTDGSNTNKSLLIDNSGSAIRLRAWDASSSLDATIITSAVSNGTFKYLIRWDNGNLKVFINGVSAGTASINAYSYTTLNLKEGSWSNNSLKQLIGFNEALTDAECVTLTTL